MEGITDIIQCSICLETFTDPRMLPCIHTFCLKCLQEIVLKTEEKQSKGKLHCPICRREFTIPAQGVEGFQKNFFMHRLKEIAMMSTTMEKSCDICLESKECEEDEVQPADVYCMQCHKNICKRCSKAHKIIADAKDHQLIQLGKEITESIVKTISHQGCPQHKGELAKMYCNDCNKVICLVCFAENHQHHKCSGIEKVGNTLRQELKNVVSEVETCLNDWLVKMQQCTEEKTNFQKNMEHITKMVITRRDELFAVIDKCTQSLIKEVATMGETRLKEIQNEMDENERQQVIIESFKAYCNQIDTKGTNVELCQIIPALKRRAEEIQQSHRTLSQQPTGLIQFDFEQTNIDEFLKTANIIGEIKAVSDSGRSIVKSKLDIPSSFKVHGVTKLDSKIYVLSSEPNVIRIFCNQAPFNLQMQLELTQIGNPNDIASSEISKCVYINEELNNCIWKITNEDPSMTEWLIGVRPGPGCLSVTSEGHLLLLIYGQSEELEIYSSGAMLICQFSLPCNIFDPQHIIQKPNGEFIISHREGTGDGPWVISRLTSDGQTVLAQFNPKDKTQELNRPLHLTLNSSDNRLFVTEDFNDRVILLHSVSLDLERVCLTKKEHGISIPWRLFYDEKIKQLIVGQWPNIVGVYNVS